MYFIGQIVGSLIALFLISSLIGLFLKGNPPAERAGKAVFIAGMVACGIYAIGNNNVDPVTLAMYAVAAVVMFPVKRWQYGRAWVDEDDLEATFK